ncbi:MAG: hypothetical protein AAGM27_00850, partial [Cyanobacteria bacterium J06554_3]
LILWSKKLWLKKGEVSSKPQGLSLFISIPIFKNGFYGADLLDCFVSGASVVSPTVLGGSP